MSARFDKRTLLGRLEGIALTRPLRHGRRGERGCVAFTVLVPAFAPPTGTIRLLGGTRRYARLRAKGSFTPTPARAGAVRLAGMIRVSRGSPRGLPARCRTLRR
jgi:hypothetical protein